MENGWRWILSPWQRKHLVLKTHFLPKMLYFLKEMSQTNFFFWLIQAPFMSSIYRDIKELKLRLLEKQLTTKLFFLFWGKKAILFKKKWQHHQNNVIALKSVYWNQCFSVWKMVGMVVRPAKVLFSPFCLKTKCTCDLPEFPFPLLLFEDLVYMWSTWSPLTSSSVWRPSVHVSYLKSPSPLSCLKTKCTCDLPEFPFPCPLFEDLVYMWHTWIPLASSPVWRPSVHVTYLNSPSLVSC